MHGCCGIYGQNTTKAKDGNISDFVNKISKQLRMDQIAPKFHKCSDISQMSMEGIKCFSKTRVWNHKPLADIEILGNNSLFNEMRVFSENNVFVGGSRFVDMI